MEKVKQSIQQIEYIKRRKRMNKKYELTDECINFYGRKLYRIKALVDFYDVKSGDLGGYVESYNNLSQEGI